ncbi:MAG: TetR/AcrR family transcriptional regulator [Capnocytophaga sp.]|nr:TetR/AcrR family transcriptional regulator [Capnocytophaga sp.]
MLYHNRYIIVIMPKSTTITKEMIIDTAFKMVRKEGFSVLSARNIAKKIGCSTQPIYWSYKNMDDLKAEICQKAVLHLKNAMSQYKKTGNPFLDLGLGYVRMAHTESALFKAFYIDNILNIQMTDIFPESQQIVELMKETDEYKKLSDEGVKNIIAKSWMLVHGVATMVATGLLVYDEEKILEILE